MNPDQTQTQSLTYIHSEEVHNLDSPQEIVKVLVEMFRPSSVVDVGCGIGTFLHCFEKQGVKDVVGIDGSWVDRKLLAKYLDAGKFIEADLQRPIAVNRKFDLLISLEVAEHLDPASSDVFIDNLTSLSDLIVFSAAIPGQDGQKHINLQWCDFWYEKFALRGYECHDILRPVFWNNESVFHWYRQNMLVYVKKNTNSSIPVIEKSGITKPLNLIHPVLFNRYVQRLTAVEKGMAGSGYYFNLFLRSLKQRFFGSK
jgi:SAM-dependent methyltransferase